MRKIGLLMLIVVLAMAGCVKVVNVKVYADAIVGTQSEVEKIAVEFVESPRRTTMYACKMNVPTKAGEELDKYKEDVATEKIWADCGQVFNELHFALIYYGLALQQLTQDEAIDFSDEIMGCSSSINGLMNANGVNIEAKMGTGFTSAVNSASSIVAKWVSEAYRRDELTKVFADDGKPILAFLEALRTASIDGYGKLLRAEKSEGKAFFVEMLEILPPADAHTLALFRERKLQFEANAKVREAVLDAYSKKMDNIIAAHRALMELAWRRNLDVEELVEEVKILATDIYTIRDNFQAIEKPES